MECFGRGGKTYTKWQEKRVMYENYQEYLAYLDDLENIESMVFLALLEYEHIIEPDGSLSVPLCEEDEQMSRLITHKRIHLLHHIAPKLSSKTLATEARLTTT